VNENHVPLRQSVEGKVRGKGLEGGGRVTRTEEVRKRDVQDEGDKDMYVDTHDRGFTKDETDRTLQIRQVDNSLFILFFKA
jgi:hypothetical protein